MNKENTTQPPKAGGGFGKFLLIALGGVALVAAGGFAGSLFGEGSAPAAAGEAPAPAPARDEPALYASLQPPLVVNFRDSSGESHYMQVTLEVMARDQQVVDAVKQHAAVVRNSLILLFSGTVDYAALNTRQHKEQMLADALSEVRKVMGERGVDGVEAVYFTSLIIQ